MTNRRGDTNVPHGQRAAARLALALLGVSALAATFLSGCKADDGTRGGAEGQFGLLPTLALRRSLLPEFARAAARGEPLRVCVAVPDATGEADAAATVAGRYLHAAITHALRQWFEASRGLMGIGAKAPFRVALRATASACLEPGASLEAALPSHDEIVVVTGKDEATFPRGAERAGWAALLSPSDPFATREVAWAWPVYRTIVDRLSAAFTKDPMKGTYVYLRRMMTHEFGHLMGLADTYRTLGINAAGNVVDLGDRGTHLPSAMQITACYEGTNRQALLLDAPTEDDKAGLRSIADFLEGRTPTVACPADRQRHRSSQSGFDFCVSRRENVPSHVQCPKVTDASGRQLSRVTTTWREAGASGNDHSHEAAVRAFGAGLDEHLPYFDCRIDALERCLDAGGAMGCYPRSCGARARPASSGAPLPASIRPTASAPLVTPTPHAPPVSAAPLPTPRVTPVSAAPQSPGVVVTPQTLGAPERRQTPGPLITPQRVR